MTAVWNNTALHQSLQQVVNGPPPTPVNLTLRIFTNNYAPTNLDTIASYVECVDTSYAAVVLTGALWVLSSMAGGLAMAYAPQTFSFAGSNNLYGWYLTNAGATLVYAAGNFSSAPVVIPSGGATYTVQVNLQAFTP